MSGSRHIVIEIPNTPKADQLKAILVAQGYAITADYILIEAKEIPGVTNISGWKTKKEVPVFIAVDGLKKGMLPAGVTVREYKTHIVTDGNIYYMEHDGGGIPGLAGWSLRNDENFLRPKLPDAKPTPVPVVTAVWWAALKKGNKIVSLNPNVRTPLYNRAGGEVVSQRFINYDMDVFAVTPDPRTPTLAWIQVSESPVYWLQSSGVKAK